MNIRFTLHLIKTLLLATGVVFSFYANACHLADDKSLTEVLISSDRPSVFTCQLIERTPNGWMAKVEKGYFGVLFDSMLVKLSGDSTFKMGSHYLIFADYEDGIYKCGGPQDKLTRVLTCSADTAEDLRLVQGFAYIVKEHCSGHFSFRKDNGTLLAKGRFLFGKPIGKWKHYYDFGKIKSTHDYSSNEDCRYSACTGYILSRMRWENHLFIAEKFSLTKKNVCVSRQEIWSDGDKSSRKTFDYFDNGKVHFIHTYLNQSTFASEVVEYDPKGRMKNWVGYR